MDKNRKIFYSFKEFYENFKKLNKENLENQRILKSYGLDIPLDVMQDIEILESNKKSITYWNRKTNELVTSNLLGKIYKKWQTKYSVSLITCNQDKTFFIEHFHSIDSAETYEQTGKNALKSRKDPKTKLLSRAYADVSTKYGDFCLHIEEGYTDYKYGSPYRFVSLYHGNHEQTMLNWMNDFDHNKYGLFRWYYVEQNKFSRWVMGFENDIFNNPKRNVWKYGRLNDTSSVYASEFLTNSNAGVIFRNGHLKLKKNTMYIPDIFDWLKQELKEYEDLDCTSKAYFCNCEECVAILKQDSTISIEYKKKNPRTYDWSKEFSDHIVSATTQEFTEEDFKNIITQLEISSISETLKSFTVSELESYKNIHNTNDFGTLDKFTLEPYHFEDMLQYIREQNLIEVVEKGIESLSSTFHMDIEELLGQNPPNQAKEPPYVKKNIKKQ